MYLLCYLIYSFILFCDAADNSPALDAKHSKQMEEYFMKYWRDVIDAKQKPQGALYAEGGPLRADELQGESHVSYYLRT